MTKRKRNHAAERMPRQRKVRNIAEGYLLGFDFDDSHAYLILGGGDIRSRLVTQVDRYGGDKRYKENRVTLRSIDGVPHTVIRVNKKFASCMGRMLTVHQVYGNLWQFLTDDDIRTCFYRLWLDERNFQASKSNWKEAAAARSRGRTVDEDHGYVRHITNAMRKTEAARSGIS